jgi:hypothetical protein
MFLGDAGLETEVETGIRLEVRQLRAYLGQTPCS